MVYFPTPLVTPAQAGMTVELVVGMTGGRLNVSPNPLRVFASLREPYSPPARAQHSL
jgi:hypothetical protein